MEKGTGEVKINKKIILREQSVEVFIKFDES